MKRRSFFDQTRDKIMVFDGGMGTYIQRYNLTADDFWGQEGCNEYLVKTRPDVVREIHAAYFAAGSDIVETNSFGSTAIVLGEYDLQDLTYELNVTAAQLAKEVAADHSAERPRYVAGSIGPTTKLPSLGHIAYDDLKASYIAQIEGLIDGGADVLLVETCQDLLQTKAALAAITQVKRQRGKDVPVMVQVTIETTGTMLVGTDIASVVTTLEPYDIDVIGMNCATGPREMSEHIRHLSQASLFYISCLPNAGIPENVGGHAHYHLTPAELAQSLTHFVTDLGVSIVGGCCGTTAEHITAVYNAVGGLSPAKRQPKVHKSLASLYSSTPLKTDPPPVLVGERTNANGSKLFRELLAQDDYDGLVGIAKSQVQEGAHVLDVCTAYVSRDEVRDMQETIRRFNSQLDVPLMIDSTEVPVIKAALEMIAGKAIVNSINLEDGEERMAQVLPLCREFGAAVVALTIDEDGMAKTAEKKLAIARRIYDIAVNQYGMAPEDIVFDPLTFTLGSGDEEFRRAGIETLEGIRLIKQHLPGAGTILGLSNISFGLKASSRHVLNSVFLQYALEAGLDMAILNSKHILPLHQISEAERTLCRQLIFDERSGDFDPLHALMAYYDTNAASVGTEKKGASLPDTVEERLKYRIINGEKPGLDADLALALETYAPLDIINTLLLDGMKTVGERFGKGEMQLPFVLQSAEVMKAAVAYLEPHMDQAGAASNKGTLVLATVKGDVHDIGKNLVDIILTNNGYKVYNIGIKQPIENILQAALEHQVDAIGMSGLLVKSTAIMKENLAILEERGIRIPVFLGGAALTPRFVEEECQPAYSQTVRYCKDAFASLRFMDELKGITTSEDDLAAWQSLGAVRAEGVETVDDAASPYQAVGEIKSPASAVAVSTQRADIADDVPIPTPPFYGTKVVADVPLETLYPFLNTQALIAGQWQVRRGSKSQEEHQAFVQEKIHPVLDDLKQRAAEFLQPQVVYGYFHCQSQGNDLIVYRDDAKTEWVRFQFPRGGAKKLCIADFFASRASGRMDVLGMQLVTMGCKASDAARKLFEAGNYTDYLYLHGFGVEMAEALAEYWHRHIRQELGIDGLDAPEIKRLFSQGYQGSRFSFGYPACPNLEDQTQLCQVLQPERIGVALSDEFMLEPEQSTSAIIVHHPEARYFDARA